MLNYRYCAAACCILFIVQSAMAGAPDGSFHNPPTAPWVSSFPYQRNVYIGFDTDPDGWPDAVSPEIGKDFVPGVNYELFGTKDIDWYLSDYGFSSGDIDGIDTDEPRFYSRQGLVGIDETEATITLHLDNNPVANPLKNVYIEIEYYYEGSGEFNVTMIGAGGETVNYHYERGGEVMGDGWYRFNTFYDIQPNPLWEEIMINFSVGSADPGFIYIDNIHIATECLPEPASMCVLVSGLGVLLMKRRRSMKT